MPPTSPSIQNHILRAMYITFLKISTLSKTRTVPEAIEFGYDEYDGYLVPKKPTVNLPLISELIPNCNCKKCKTKNCCCLANSIQCIRFCGCQEHNTCDNPRNKVVE